MNAGAHTFAEARRRAPAVYVVARDTARRERVAEMLRRAGLGPVTGAADMAADMCAVPGRETVIPGEGTVIPGEGTVIPGEGTVIVAVAGTVDEAVDEAVDAVPAADHGGGYPLLVIADRILPAGVPRAVRAGVRTMLRWADTTPGDLAAAVHAARHGDSRIPHEVLIRLLGKAHQAPGATGSRIDGRRSREHGRSPLTARQTSVLALLAEGHRNAEIARSLACSEHTVKNVIYELMSRLQVRNRAHAVACGVRDGLI